MQRIRNYRVVLLGVVTMIVAFVWSVLGVDDSVPNDANIGAGLLFLAGIGIVIVGLAMRWVRRTSSTPPPPKP